MGLKWGRCLRGRGVKYGVSVCEGERCEVWGKSGVCEGGWGWGVTDFMKGEKTCTETKGKEILGN